MSVCIACNADQFQCSRPCHADLTPQWSDFDSKHTHLRSFCGQSGTGTGLFLTNSTLLCQCHSTKAPYLIIIIIIIILPLSNGRASKHGEPSNKAMVFRISAIFGQARTCTLLFSFQMVQYIYIYIYIRTLTEVASPLSVHFPNYKCTMLNLKLASPCIIIRFK